MTGLITLRRRLAGSAVFAAAMAVGIFVSVPSSHALDSSFDAMSQSGTHQFYVWCTGRADRDAQRATGKNASDAQAKLARRVGARCWPIWQGLKEDS